MITKTIFSHSRSGQNNSKQNTIVPQSRLLFTYTFICLQIMWPLLYPEWYKKLDVKRTKGVLIHGPPGCGKTTLVRAMASMAGATFLSISAASIFSPYVGDSEKSLTQVFHKARLGKEVYKSSIPYR